MKLYKGKRTKAKIDRRVNNRVPDRDAIIWSINVAQHYAYVKIQGSNEQIKAHFPKNWHEKPYWLKQGCSVLLRHRGGIRGYIEIVGPGRTIPTAMTGGDTPDIDDSVLEDTVLTGLDVTPTAPLSMAVAISSGTYRINGTTYSFDAESSAGYLMTDPTSIVMTDNNPITMGAGDYTVAIDAAPSTTPDHCEGGQARIDILVIGTDGTIDYIKGTEDWLGDWGDSGPTIPSTPTDHVLITTIFVMYGMSSIERSDIDFVWTTPRPTKIVMYCNHPGSGCPSGADTFDSSTLEECETFGKHCCAASWGLSLWPDVMVDYPPFYTITLFIQDQYGRCVESLEGSTINVEFLSGGGKIIDVADVTGPLDGNYHSGTTYIEGETLALGIDDDGKVQMVYAAYGAYESPTFRLQVDGHPTTRRSLTIGLPGSIWLTSTTTTTTTI